MSLCISRGYEGITALSICYASRQGVEHVIGDALKATNGIHTNSYESLF